MKLVIVPFASCVTLEQLAGKHPFQTLYCQRLVTSSSDEKLSSRVTNTLSVGCHCKATRPSLRRESVRSRYMAWSWMYQLGTWLATVLPGPLLAGVQPELAGAVANDGQGRYAPFQPTSSKWWPRMCWAGGS